MDIRQSPQWGKYLSGIGWTIENIGKTQIFIKKVPLLNFSVIKIEHPQNPLPFEKIDALAKKYHALFVLIEPENKGFKKELFRKHGFDKSYLSLTHTSTIQINLKPSQKKIYANFSENARRNIKKAQKNNLLTKIIFLDKEKEGQNFQEFYKLLQSLSKIKKFFIPKFEEFCKKMLAFQNNSLLLFAQTQQNPQPIAVVWAAFNKEKMFYMHTGITLEGYQKMANYLLVWEAIKVAKSLKLKIFDFEGIFDPRFPKERKAWKNFSEFKKRFHGEIIEYPHPWIKCYNIIFKIFYLCSNRLFQ